jgi:hypothetical protein
MKDDAKFLLDIKAGTNVWVGTRNEPRKHGVKLVDHVTPTQIVIKREGMTDVRYYRRSGVQIGTSFIYVQIITGIASASDVRMYQWQVRRAKYAEQRREKAETARELRRKNLYKSLFNASRKVTLLPSDGNKSWCVDFRGLSEKQLTKLAKAAESILR